MGGFSCLLVQTSEPSRAGQCSCVLVRPPGLWRSVCLLICRRLVRPGLVMLQIELAFAE